MKNTDMPVTRYVNANNVSNVSIAIAEPITNNGSQTIVIKQVVENKESSTTASLILIAGIVFWAHGSSSHDAWFKGEELTGQIITGIYIAAVGLLCCCCCCAGCIAATDAKDSELDISSNERSRATKYLSNNQPRQLLTDIFTSKVSQISTNEDVNVLSSQFNV